MDSCPHDNRVWATDTSVVLPANGQIAEFRIGWCMDCNNPMVLVIRRDQGRSIKKFYPSEWIERSV